MRQITLLTGATGCIGRRLLLKLEADGKKVRCLVRRPEALAGFAKAETEVVHGDLFDKPAIARALAGVGTAYYLVHSMQKGRSFEALDREAARNFAEAAREANVERIIYLGGLGDDRVPLSNHLRSRHETGDILRTYGGQVIEFRSSVVIGSGSLSFEMIRALVERLPVMVTPRWVRLKTQPIGIENLLEFLTRAHDVEVTGSPIFEIGGADIVSYGDLIEEYARQRGLTRWMIPVPVLSSRLSGIWLSLVTPLYARAGRALIDSIRFETVVRNPWPRDLFKVQPIGMEEAIRRAISLEDTDQENVIWPDMSGLVLQPIGGRWVGNRLADSRSGTVNVPPERAFEPISTIGGPDGWYSWDILWRLRGLLDRLMGGVGLRREKSVKPLRVGNILDFWRVEAYDPPRRLRLRAEMRLPGEAWLQFEVSPHANGSIVRQTAIFNPRGVGGLLYWYALFPIHALIFPSLLKKILKEINKRG